MVRGTEQTVLSVIEKLREKGHEIPDSVVDIPHFPFRNFEALAASIQSGQIRLQRLSSRQSESTLRVLGTRAERTLFTTYLSSFLLLPALSVVLAFVQSKWWLVIGILGPIVSFRATKQLYNRVVYRAALRSELEFCFLYFFQEVCLTSVDFRRSWYWGLTDDPQDA